MYNRLNILGYGNAHLGWAEGLGLWTAGFTAQPDFQIDQITALTFEPLSKQGFVFAIEDDDFAGGINTTGSIIEGGDAIAGRIDFTEDTDWFQFDGVAGQQMVITVHSSRYLTLSLTLYDAVGDFASIGAVISFENDTVTLTFTADVSAVYYVEVYGSAASATYTIELDNVDDDFAGDITTTGQLTLNSAISGSFEALGDEDWFAFTADAGTVYSFLIEGQAIFDNLPTITIYDDNGDSFNAQQVVAGDSSTGYLVILDTQISGNYFFGLAGGSIDGNAFNYSVTMSQSQNDDYDGGVTTDGVITDGQTINGNLDFSDDTDWLAFTITAGQLVEFDLAASDTDGFILRIFDASGTELSVGGDLVLGRNGVSLSRVIDTAGTYYIEIASQFSQPDVTNYSLSYSAITDDYTNNIQTTGVIVPDGSVTGITEVTGDQDWFAFTINAGDSVHFTIEVENELAYTLNIYDANGDIVVTGLGDVPRGVFFNAAESGTYYVGTESGAFGSTSGLSYTISREDVADLHAGDTSTAGRIEIGGAARGTISSADDRDWFEITAEAGQIIELRDLALEASYEFNLYDSNGNFQLTYTGPIEVLVAGTYYIEVRFPFGEVTQPLHYNLFAFAPDEALTLSGASDHFIGTSANETIFGGDGDDVINGGLGDDTLVGEAGADIFVITFGGGNDTVIDFENGIDRLEIGDLAYNFGALKIVQSGADTIIYTGSATVTLENTQAADIDASDFSFRMYSSARPRIEKSEAQEDLDVSDIAAFLTDITPNTSPKLAMPQEDGAYAEMINEVDAYGWFDLY